VPDIGHYPCSEDAAIPVRSRYSIPMRVLTALMLAATLAGCAALAAHPSGQGRDSSTPAAEVLASPPASTPVASTPTPSASPSVVSASATLQPPVPPVHPVVWQVHVYLITLTRVDHSLVVAVVDSRGVQPVGDREFGSFDLVLTLVVNANPCCSIGPSPTPTPLPATYVQHYVGCCTPEYMYVNMAFGGTWAVRGTVTWGGQTKPVSASGTVSWP
jgi:hypothetical protein